MSGGGAITGSKAAITAIAMTAATMAFVDISIVSTSLSEIRASFGTSVDRIGWVATAYMMANIVIIPMTGFLQRRFGYRNYFAGSVALFTFASALCCVAWDFDSLVAFRALQGMGGGAIIPTAHAILFARYPQSEHGTASALFGLGAVTGPLIGPSLGGYFVEWFGWHSIFLVNVPIGIVVAAAAVRRIEEPGFRPATEDIDVTGIALLAIGMPALQFVLEEGSRRGWLEDPAIEWGAAIAAIALITFVVHELEVSHPVVDLGTFRDGGYAAATVVNALTGMAIFGGSYLLSLYCGTVLQYRALDIARVLLTPAAIQLVVMPIVGKVAVKIDARILVASGLAIVAGSLLLAARLTGQAGFGDVSVPPMVRAAGVGLVMIPVSLVALSHLPADRRGNATGLLSLTRELGGSLGTAWAGTVLTRGLQEHGAYLAESVSTYGAISQDQYGLIRSRLGWVGRGVAEALLAAKVRGEAGVLSFSDAFRAMGAFLALGLLVVPLLSRSGGK